MNTENKSTELDNTDKKLHIITHNSFIREVLPTLYTRMMLQYKFIKRYGLIEETGRELKFFFENFKIDEK